MAPIAISPPPSSGSLAAPFSPKSILRAGLKRSAQDLDAEPSSDATCASSAKRRKVTFVPRPDVRILESDDDSSKTVSTVREEIRAAVTQHQRGDDEAYNEVKRVFTTEKEEDDDDYDDEAPLGTGLLSKYIAGLTSTVSLLDRSCSDLVHAVLDFKWLGRDDAFVQFYTRFLGNLISSHGGYVSPVLKMLVENFAHTSTSAARMSMTPGLTRADLQQRVHTAIKHLLQLMPSAGTVLHTRLLQGFPDRSDTKKAHVEYVRNLLQLATSLPELKGEILDIITDKLVKIDMSVQEDIEDLEEDIGDLLVQDSMSLSAESYHRSELDQDEYEDDDDDFSDTASESSDDSADAEEERIKELRTSVMIMDSILDQLFAYYGDNVEKSSSRDSSRTFEHLLAQFRKTILRTHQLRHTQFITFHFAQTSPELATRFIDSCVQIMSDVSRSSDMRSAAVAYIASFVARGAKLTTDTVLYTFDTLASFADDQRKTFEPTCRAPDRRRYETYYATVQALIYIFCFRWRDLLSDPDEVADESDDELLDGRDLTWAPGVKEAFNANFMSRLNALKVCAPEIVEEFARIAHTLGFLYIYQLLEANKRVRLSSVATSSTRETALSGLYGERHQQLLAYFPFDPYRLPRSKRWLEGDYVEWKGLPGQQADSGAQEPDSSGDEENEDDDEMVDEGTETPDEDE